MLGTTSNAHFDRFGINQPLQYQMTLRTSQIPLRRPAFWLILGACSFFYVAGRAFIPHLGIQTDEALFGAGIYQVRQAFYTVTIWHSTVPLMLETYVGTLKSLIYTFVFKFWTPSASSTRTPVLLAGILTLYLFYLLVRRVAGERAALVGALLLATDATFLLTTVFDWGPVALQHLLLMAGVLLLHKYYERPAISVLCVAFFLFGLASWDKALFVWSLTGLLVAAAVTFPRELWRLCTLRRIGAAFFAFCLGALPLIVYNVDRPLDTFRSNAALRSAELVNKAIYLGITLEGRGLIGWMFRLSSEDGHPVEPRTALQRASTRLHDWAGSDRRTLLVPALAVSVLLIPVLWRARQPGARALWFALVFVAVTWLQMALNRNTGGSAHHTVLVWPFPHMMIAIALAGSSYRVGRYGRPALAALVVLMLAANLLVVNEHYAVMLRNGGGLVWTDAVFPLADFVKQVKATQVMALDWGFLDSLRLLGRGQIPLRNGMDPTNHATLDAHDREAIHQWLLTPGTVFVSHTDGNEIFPGVNAHLEEVARAAGFAREMMGRFQDRNGREIFLVFRYPQVQ
jgi:4-amino-4-deoxy-L-arabinose transferase-like glycosyltransferase